MEIFFSWERGKKRQFTKNFNSSEFECKCGKCKSHRISVMMLSKLQELREEIRCPIYISSACRCIDYQNSLMKYNKHAVKKSQHVLGKALDIVYPKEIDQERFIDLIKKKFYCLGVGKTFIHVDMRKDFRRLWIYE